MGDLTREEDGYTGTFARSSCHQKYSPLRRQGRPSAYDPRRHLQPHHSGAARGYDSRVSERDPRRDVAVPTPELSGAPPPRRRKRDRIRTVVQRVGPSRSFLGDVTAIVVGVCLALWLHSWWEEVRGADEGRTALTALSSEIAVNRVVLDGTADYHVAAEEALRTIAARHDAGEASANPATAIPDGLRPARLQRTAWQTALATDTLDRLDFATLEALARVYTTQEAYDLLAANLLQAVTAANFTGDLHDLERRPQITAALLGAVRDLLGQEEILQAAYRDAEVALASHFEEQQLAADAGP